jgi:hypothetical protein
MVRRLDIGLERLVETKKDLKESPLRQCDFTRISWDRCCSIARRRKGRGNTTDQMVMLLAVKYNIPIYTSPLMGDQAAEPKVSWELILSILVCA